MNYCKFNGSLKKIILPGIPKSQAKNVYSGYGKVKDSHSDDTLYYVIDELNPTLVSEDQIITDPSYSDDYRIGYATGYLSAKEGTDLEAVKLEYQGYPIQYVDGLIDGYTRYIQEVPEQPIQTSDLEEAADSIKMTISRISKLGTKFNRFGAGLKEILDFINEVKVTIKDDEYTIGSDGSKKDVVVKLDNAEKADEYLKDNPDMRIIKTDEDGTVYLSSKDMKSDLDSEVTINN